MASKTSYMASKTSCLRRQILDVFLHLMAIYTWMDQHSVTCHCHCLYRSSRSGLRSASNTTRHAVPNVIRTLKTAGSRSFALDAPASGMLCPLPLRNPWHYVIQKERQNSFVSHVWLTSFSHCPLHILLVFEIGPISLFIVYFCHIFISIFQ